MRDLRMAQPQPNVRADRRRDGTVPIANGGTPVIANQKRGDMAGIDADVMATFLDRLEEYKDLPATITEKLGAVLAQEKLPKPDELATLYSAESGDPVA
jgi:hypothetical protein